MDAITRVSYYFPTRSLTTFWILANVVISNTPECIDEDQQLLTALIVIFSLFVVMVSFTDAYTASNAQVYPVLIFPVYGPVCFMLPSVDDKDRVYDAFYLKVRDYLHAILSLATFVLIAVFINPISTCLYPSTNPQSDEASKFSDSTVRTIPIVVALIAALMMMCLGPPRQMIGLTNVPETCSPPDFRGGGSNPIYTPRSSVAGEDVEYGGGPAPPLKQQLSMRSHRSGYAGAPKQLSYSGSVQRGRSDHSNRNHRPVHSQSMPLSEYNQGQREGARSRSMSPAPGIGDSRRSRERSPGPTLSPRLSNNPSSQPQPWDGAHVDYDNGY
eukprot:gene7518-665_t